jgi:hypothetical protein
VERSYAHPPGDPADTDVHRLEFAGFHRKSTGVTSKLGPQLPKGGGGQAVPKPSAWRAAPLFVKPTF